MHVRDLAEIVVDEDIAKDESDSIISIPKPTNEPTVGTIDTQFDKRVYFHDWVVSHNMVDLNITITTEDRFHGTAVTSIIVDGPAFNPKLDDGCGRFRVRHFGVATAGGFSSFTMLKMIRDIIASNRDIKGWNLSLGSAMEIDPNFISPEAAELDKIQCEYDVIFVVAGTNKTRKMAYLIHIVGLSREVAKALIIDSAAGWNRQDNKYFAIGYEVVPKRIEDITHSKDDEIRFIMNGLLKL